MCLFPSDMAWWLSPASLQGEDRMGRMAEFKELLEILPDLDSKQEKPANKKMAN